MVGEWLRRLPPNGTTSFRLVCAPSAGAGTTPFFRWNDLLPGAEIQVVQLPGREARMREVPARSIQDVAAAVADALSGLPRYPTVLFGHSMGALVAFEIARRLEPTQAIGALAISARRAPCLPERYPPIAHLDRTAFIRAVQARYGGIPDVVLNDADLLDLFIPILQADMAMIERYDYQPEPALACPVFGYGGTDDRTATAAELEGWKATTRGTGTVRMFPGGHFFNEALKNDLVSTLRRDIDVVLPRVER